AADVGAEEVHHRSLAEGAQERELHGLRQQRQAEVEVEDVRPRGEPCEGPPLRRLLTEESATALQVDVRLRVEGVAVEDDELRVDAACAQRAYVRPGDAGGVDGGVRDAHNARLA